VFGDALIAPKHAIIVQDGGRFVIRTEPGQTMWVNNALIQNAVLQNGDQLQVGRTRLAFRRKGK
jgi:predicted component of type VI protein secretion system